MLCFSTSWQSPRWGRIVNLNGLFGLEVCMCVYVRVCSCMCLFWSMRAFKLQQGCVGWWLHAQLIGQLGYFRATLTSTGRPGSTTHTHMSNTHMLKSKHKVSSSQMLLSASKLYYWHMRAVLMWHTVMQSWDTHMALISSFKCGKHVCLRKPMALCSATAAKLFPYRFKKCSIDRKISWGALFI